MFSGRVRPWVVGGIVVALVVALVAAAPRVVRSLGFFRVRRVEVVGNRYLSAADVVSRLHLANHASIFDPLDQVRRRASAIGGVTSAVVTRRLPGTLRVTIRESEPVAMASVGHRIVLIDFQGHVLPFDPARSPASLPLASCDAATAGVLARVRVTDDALYQAVESAHADHGDVVLDINRQEIRVRAGADADVLRGVAAARSYLTEKHIPWRALDARYPDRIFVRTS